MGNVRPCNHSTTILGNLFEEPFSDLVSPERLCGFTESLPAYCTVCDQRTLCQGGCKAAAQVCYGSLTEMEPFLKSNNDLQSLPEYQRLKSQL